VVLVVLLLVHIQIGEVYLLHLRQLVLAFQMQLLVVVAEVAHLHTEVLRKHLAVAVVAVMVEQQVLLELPAELLIQVLVVVVLVELIQLHHLMALAVQAVQV
jgi:hypothetical protein